MPKQTPPTRPRTSTATSGGTSSDASAETTTDASTDAGPLPDDVAGLSYEQARDELVAVVGRLESGGESLEESLSLWERGEALAARCQQWLDGARERLAAARGDGPRQGDDAPDQDGPARS